MPSVNKIKAVILDIDETLSSDVSWLTLTAKLGGSADDHLRIYSDYKAGATDYNQARNELLALWQKTGRASKREFQKIFDQIPLHDRALSVVNQLKRSYRLCLITGSMDLYAQTVANKLDISEWYANTTLNWDSAGKLVGMDYELNQSAKKLAQFNSYCMQHGLQAKDCIVVGDGENDLAMFDACGRGVLVGPKQPAEFRNHASICIDDVGSLPAALQANYGQ